MRLALPRPRDAETLLTRTEVAQLLKVHINTFQLMLVRGEYPAADFHVGTRPRWRLSSHERWIERQSKGGAA